MTCRKKKERASAGGQGGETLIAGVKPEADGDTLLSDSSLWQN